MAKHVTDMQIAHFMRVQLDAVARACKRAREESVVITVFAELSVDDDIPAKFFVVPAATLGSKDWHYVGSTDENGEFFTFWPGFIELVSEAFGEEELS